MSNQTPVGGLDVPGPAGPMAIGAEVPCAVCGYSLKGLDPDGNCPECGQSISRTFVADLSRSGPAWLGAVAQTMFWLAALAFLNNFSTPIDLGRIAPYSLTWYYVGLTPRGVAAAAMVVAAFRLARPESPGAATGTNIDLWRRGTCVAAVAYVGVMVLICVPAAFTWEYRTLIGVVASLALLAMNILVPLQLDRLVRRAGDRSLAVHARGIAWALPAQLVVQLAWNGLRVGETLGAVGSMVLSVGVTVIGFAYLLLLGRLHERLRAAQRSAITSAAA